MIADAEGYEIEYVPYNEEGQVQTSLLSGAIDAMVSNPGSIIGQVEAGEMTPLLFTGAERLRGSATCRPARSTASATCPRCRAA